MTNDPDFLAAAAVDTTHCGIAFCPQGKRSFGNVIRHLALMHDVMDENEMLRRIEYL